jgi:hypothetical protein
MEQTPIGKLTKPTKPTTVALKATVAAEAQNAVAEG